MLGLYKNDCPLFSTVYIIVNSCKLDQRNAVRTRLWLKTLLRMSLEEIKEERGRWQEGEHNKKMLPKNYFYQQKN